MARIYRIAGLALSLGCAACSLLPQRAKVEIRPVNIQQVRLPGEDVVRGDALFQRGEYALALEAYRRAVRADPESARAYNGLAISYAAIGRFDLSGRYFELALSRAPADPKIYRNLARSLEKQGKADEARLVLVQMEQIHQAAPLQAPDVTAPKIAAAQPSVLVTAQAAEPRIPLSVIAATDTDSIAPEQHKAGPRIARLSPGEVYLETAAAKPRQQATRLQPRLVTTIREVRAAQPVVRLAVAQPSPKRIMVAAQGTQLTGLHRRLTIPIRDVTVSGSAFAPPTKSQLAKLRQDELAMMNMLRCLPVGPVAMALSGAARTRICGSVRG